jgi:hypothetical protein
MLEFVAGLPKILFFDANRSVAEEPLSTEESIKLLQNVVRRTRSYTRDNESATRCTATAESNSARE